MVFSTNLNNSELELHWLPLDLPLVTIGGRGLRSELK
jgi:hypothetical protein